jgi:DMSO/TMAO reductase YedYZ molybdopterin-dependent catalytic subunit
LHTDGGQFVNSQDTIAFLMVSANEWYCPLLLIGPYIEALKANVYWHILLYNVFMRNTTLFTVLVLLLSACGNTSGSQPASPSNPTAAPQAANLTEACGLEPVEQPSLPVDIPAYTEIDPATGLHMTGTPVLIDLSSYRFTVTGLVDNPISLTYDQLRCLPKITADPELNCPGFFTDYATWAGVSLAELLKLAQPQSGASRINLVAEGGYRAQVDINTAMNPANFLVYELDGKTLPVIHGFPLRAVFPGEYGSTWVKWLVGIEVE